MGKGKLISIMIRSSLSNVVRRNGQAAAECNGTIFRHKSPSLEYFYGHVSQRRYPTRQICASCALHSQDDGEKRAYPPWMDQIVRNDKKGRYINKHGGGRRGGNNKNINRHGNPNLDPSYLSHLEQRAKDHIQKFPIDHSPASISHWHRTTVELIMLMSKLWGRGSNHRSNQMQINKFVPLANDLLEKVLLIRKNEIDAAIVVDSLLDETDNDKRESSHKIENMSTQVLCQAVALGLSRCDPKIVTYTARNAQNILETLEDICSKRGKLDGNSEVSFNLRDVTPSVKLYNHVLSCWSRLMHPGSERHAKKLLDRMSEPDVISYNNLLNLYANQGNVSAAEELLEEMEQPNHQVSADVYSNTIVMNAYQRRFTSCGPKERNMKDPERAEELLSRLVDRYEKSGFRDKSLRPTNVTFGTVISMYAQADRMLKEDERKRNQTRSWKAMDTERNYHKPNVAWGAKNAERVLEWIIGLSERERQCKNISGGRDSDAETKKKDGAFNPDNEVIRPSSHHFVTVMDAWAKARKGVEGAQHCEQLLDRIVELYNKLGYAELRPNPLCFGAVINAWSNADNEYETAEHAESFLGRMEDLFLSRKSSNPREMLSVIAYNLVIDAWSRRSGKDTAERADKILRRLLNNYQLTNNMFLRPDVISYTGVMKSYVNRPDGGEKALQILEEMNAQFGDGNVKARPDAKALAVVIDACAKSGLMKDAEYILNGIDDSEKTFVLFNTIMSGYKSKGLGREAEAILRRMIDLSEIAGWKRCSPDVVSYSLCIEAWGNSTSQDRVSRARALFDESMERYESGDANCKPSNLTFNALAETIASSDKPEKELLLLSLFEQMEDVGCELNLVSFNILIKTCGTASGSDERRSTALQIASSAFNSLPSVGLRPDSITYTAMIHAMINLVDDPAEKVKAISGIFNRCCEDGCLNQHMINLIIEATSEAEFLSINGVSAYRKPQMISNLPAKWSHRSSELN